MYFLILQRILVESWLDLLLFPLWWYSVGTGRAAAWCFNFFLVGNDRLAPWLWIRNISVPMYGQYDWQGRIISVFMRLVQIFFRAVFLLIWLFWCLIIFFVWLLLPVLVMVGLFNRWPEFLSLFFK